MWYPLQGNYYIPTLKRQEGTRKYYRNLMDTISNTKACSGACPARALLDRIANKWTALVVGILGEANSPVRFSEVRRAVNGISQKMLTQTLRDLERDGLVARHAYPVIPPRVEYSLTELGRTLEEPMRAVSLWAERHMLDVGAAQKAFDRKSGSLQRSRDRVIRKEVDRDGIVVG